MSLVSLLWWLPSAGDRYRFCSGSRHTLQRSQEMFLAYLRRAREIGHHSLIASRPAVPPQPFTISLYFRFRDDPGRRRRHVPRRLSRQEVRPEVRGDHQAVPHHQLHLAHPHLRLPRALLQRPVRRSQRRLHVSQSVSTAKLCPHATHAFTF